MYTTDALTAFTALTSELNGNGLNFGSSEGFDETTTYEPLGNVLGYKSEAYDAKVAAAYAQKNLAKRADLLHEAEALLLDDMPIIPLIFNQAFYVSTDLSGLSFGYNGYVSKNIIY
jgi:ABC-type oligopeptide transport system substrate-binding subunit